MSKGKLRCAIVGCGGIAQVHAGVLSRLESAELAAFADIRPERAQALAEKHGGRAYQTLDALLAEERLDVLHICTPHSLHLPMAQTAAERGIHIFSEKPPVISHAQWEEFQQLEEQVRVGVCFQNRYNPSTAFCRELLASGEAGRLLGARAFVTWRREAPYYTESGWRGSLSTEGGGALINQAIHTLDLMVEFMGPGRVLGASLANRHLPGVIEVEDTLEAAVEFAAGRGLFYATTAHCVDAPVLLELVCERLTLRIEGEEVTVRRSDGVERRDFSQSAGQAAGKSYWGASHGRCIEDFYRCVQSGERFPNDTAGVAHTVELMLEIYDRARGKQ